MTKSIELTGKPLPWQSLENFTASTTLPEKVWGVVNNLLFTAAGLRLCAFASGVILPPALSYASYVILALTVRKIASTVIGYVVYSATRRDKKKLAKKEQKQFIPLTKQEFITQKITLHKSGTSYDAILIGHKDTIANRKWSVHALGNGMAMEHSMFMISLGNKRKGANTLLINGPGVGRSKGFPTRYQMSAGFEAGLQLLEKEVKATHIALQGLSLGGGMMSEAIQAHTFNPNVNYLGVFNRTFSYLSVIAAELAGYYTTPFLRFCTTPLFYLSGTELDSVSGAEKLKKLKIEHLIIQHTGGERTDGVIPDDIGLASKLSPCETRTFLLSPEISHVDSLPDAIEMQLTAKIKTFFESKAIVSETI